MDQLNHYDYYVTRAQVSRDLSQRASNPSIAVVHSELAMRYENLAAQHERDIGIARSAQA